MKLTIAAIVVGMLFVGWLNADPMPSGEPVTMTDAQREAIHKMLETPILSPEEWQKSCDPMHGQKWASGESLDSHCSIQVVVDCPPDCGVYKTLKEDKLLRRVW